jgi:hypothetical protein
MRFGDRFFCPPISCIRRHLQLVVGAAIDVESFKKLPSHYFQILGNDPIYTAFLSMMMEITRDVPHNDQLSFVCDDEEQTALYVSTIPANKISYA